MRKGRDTIRRSVKPWRHCLVLALLFLGLVGLGARGVFLHILNQDFLQHQGELRTIRTLTLPAHRGIIYDRRGEPLAVSTPVDAVWVDPQKLERGPSLKALAALLGLRHDLMEAQLERHRGKRFLYLKRHVPPALSQKVRALGIPGVYLQREYRRYYPATEIAAHVLGFTDIDDRGQEGLELAFDDWLRGVPGHQRVIQDRYGQVVEPVDRLLPPRPGRDLTLSLDLRLQYLAYRELKAAVKAHRAKGGSLVLLDARKGEVLALANQPGFNPNDPRQRRKGVTRNRALTDVFEPGSTLKPFIIACALASGRYRPHTPIDTRPGFFRVAGKTIRDIHDYGLIDVATVIKKSSNVGASRIALSLPARDLWDTLVRVGFGTRTQSGFPGEREGVLRDYRRWRTLDQATVGFGYGLSVTALQLARAYGVLARDGQRLPVSFLPVEDPVPEPVMDPRVVREVRAMMEGVVKEGGTATRAAIPGYRVAGKTGTVRKIGRHGYENRYLALFVGMAPATDPRLVMAVVVDEPQGKAYYGGQVAAPVFAKVMGEALRLLNIPPDAPLPELHVALRP